MALQPGTLVLNGRYRIDDLLGEGASAEVYLATQLKLRAPRALKILRRAAAGGDTARIDEYRARFELEGELQEKLGDNPGIVRVHDTDEHEGAPVLVMEYLPGKTLKTALQALGGRGMPWQRCAEVLREVASGLEALHEKYYVHRDVKPSNVLFAANGRAKLGDLGVAQTDLTRTRTDGLLFEHPGTPGYASPEHANGGAYLTPAADVYALGVMGYEMLTGNLPQHVTKGRSDRAMDAEAPAWLKELVRRMLAWDYRQRPQSGGAVAEEIRRGLQSEREREAQKVVRTKDLRAQIEEALKLGRLVEADTLVDELLKFVPDDPSAQTLERRVNRAFVEEKRRIAAEETKRNSDAEAIRIAREQAERRRAEEEAKRIADEATRVKAAEVTVRQQAAEKAAREREARNLREKESAAAAAELKRKTEEAARMRREEELRRRIDTQDENTAKQMSGREASAVTEPTIFQPKPAPGVSISRRAVIVGAGALGALGLGLLATRGGAFVQPMTPPLAPPRPLPTVTNAASGQPPSSTATPAPSATVSPSPTATPYPPARRIGADRAILTLASGVEMDFVRVPAGEFLMGSDRIKDPAAYDNELPQHLVTLPEYWIGRTEVTVAQFSAFVSASRAKTRASNDLANKADHPVVSVSWDDCNAFCEWVTRLGSGEVALPSEAEWEKAARGTDGRVFPWGNTAPDETKLNFGGRIGTTTPVGKYGASGSSPYGCVDMAGNVWEWTRSLWGGTDSKPDYGYPYPTRQAVRENLEADRDVLRVLRGGAFQFSAQNVRCAFRSAYLPSLRMDLLGFRVILRLPSL